MILFSLSELNSSINAWYKSGSLFAGFQAMQRIGDACLEKVQSVTGSFFQNVKEKTTSSAVQYFGQYFSEETSIGKLYRDIQPFLGSQWREKRGVLQPRNFSELIDEILHWITIIGGAIVALGASGILSLIGGVAFLAGVVLYIKDLSSSSVATKKDVAKVEEKVTQGTEKIQSALEEQEEGNRVAHTLMLESEHEQAKLNKENNLMLRALCEKQGIKTSTLSVVSQE